MQKAQKNRKAEGVKGIIPKDYQSAVKQCNKWAMQLIAQGKHITKRTACFADTGEIAAAFARCIK